LRGDPDPDQRLRVFVSSIVGERGELAQERRAVERAISTLRLTPVMFELGARPHPPQRLYRAYLARATSSSAWTGSGTDGSAQACRSRGWRRSSSWPGAAAAVVRQDAGARP